MSDRPFSLSVNELLQKTEHYDKDERYMATSDLCVQLQRHTNLTLDPTLERRICSTILSLLNDDSNDVQAIAVKTLGVLLTVVQQDQVVEIAQRLQSLLLDQDKADLRDVYTIGLRTLIKTIPPTMGNAVCERLYYHTISGIDNISDENIVLALIDVLTELLTRFGGLLVMHHEAILQALMARLKGSANNVVKRRASDALGCTSVVLSDLLLTRLVDMLLQQIQQQEQQATTGTGTNDSRAYIRTMCVISGSVGHRLAQRIDAILPMFLRLCPPSAAAATYNDDGGDDFDQEHQFDDNYDLQERDQDQKQLVLTNELRESCFAGFESFITRCPLEIMPYLPQLVNACLAYMCYDPNYTYDLDQEDAGDAMANDEGNYEEEDEEFSDEDDFSDDDDESWKLRRAAIRCLVAIVDAMKGDPTKLWTEYGVAEALVNRFKERVENCRVDVIDCFSRLLSVTIAMTKSKVCVTAANSQSSRNREIEAVLLILRKTIPSIINSCEKQLSNKKSGERTKSSALSLLSATCQSPFGLGGSEQIASVLRQVQALLKDPDEPKAIKLEALRLVRMILTCPDNSVEDILVMLPSLLPELCRAAQEEWYKITAEALRILAKIPDLILVSYNAEGVPLLSPESVASSMYAAIENRLKAHDLDQEIKECSLLAAASLVRNFHEYLPQQDREALLCVILERLKNEITRMSALKTLSIIASPTRRAGQTKVDLLCILPDSVRELSSLLRQQSRTLKQHVLETLKILVIGYGVNLSSDSYELILKETGNIISDSDLHVSHLGLQVALAVVKIKPSTGLLLRSSILPQALNLAASPLLQDLALDSLLELFEAMIIADIVSVQEMRTAALDRLPKGNDALASKSAIVNLAKCIAVTTCAAAESVRTETVSTLIQSLEGMDSNILLLQLSLLTSGEIGQRLDLNQLSGSVAVQLRTLYIRYLDDSNEEIRTAAAYALGRAAVGSKEVFLPPIIEAFESSSQKKQYLLLSSLQEVVKCHQKNHQDLSTSVSVIVPHLVQHFSAKEEGVRKMVADCIGSLCCLQPKEILPLLETLTVAHAGKHVKADADSDVASEDSLICWTLATSVKNAVSNKVPVLEMQPAIPTFLTLLQEEDLSAKLAALIMVYATVHHMPELLTTLMKDRILPSLQEVAQLNLKRTVDLGPFKHTVDDAIPLRKAALSIFSTSLESCPDIIDISAFLPILVRACDDVEDIQLQAHHIVLCMCLRHPQILVTNVESFIVPLENAINKKKGSKAGTELERVNELIKSALRVMLALSRLEGVSSSVKFADFMERTIKNTKNAPLLQTLEEER